MGEHKEHRADVRLDNGLVIELQHSTISLEMIAAREQFYGSMAWIFNANRFAKNVEIRKRHSEYVVLSTPSVLDDVEEKVIAIEDNIKVARSKLARFSKSYDGVKERLRPLPVNLLEESFYQESAESLIASFGHQREGLIALSKAAVKHRGLIKKVLLNLPPEEKVAPYFELCPWDVLDHLILGTPAHTYRLRNFQTRWQQRVWPKASREQQAVVGIIAHFIWHNVTTAAPYSASSKNSVYPSGRRRTKRKAYWRDEQIGSVIADAAIDNIGYLAAAKKLRSDILSLKCEINAQPDFYPSELSIVRVASFNRGVCTVRALKVALKWKRRRKSLFTCDRPQLWDFGSDYLLYFEKLMYDEDVLAMEPMSGYLIRKADFITGVVTADMPFLS